MTTFTRTNGVHARFASLMSAGFKATRRLFRHHARQARPDYLDDRLLKDVGLSHWDVDLMRRHW